MVRNKKIMIGISLIIITTGCILFFSTVNQSISQKETESGKAILIIDNIELLSYEFNQAITAFDLLKKSGLDLEVKNYDIGVFIEAIGDKRNGQDNKYWLYHVNGEMPMMAADKYMLKSGDKVEFKFEAIDKNLF